MNFRSSAGYVTVTCLVLASLQLMAVVHAQGLPKAPKAPELPAAPKAPELPAAPKAPELPAAPKAPELPAAPGGEAPAGDAPGAEGSEDEPAAEPTQLRNKLPPELWSASEQDAALRSQADDKTVFTVEQIVNPEIVTASNKAESSRSAPAWVITLTQKDLVERGYTELSQVLDDLPSMDIIRPYGDNFLKNYWRGYRNNIGASFLLLMDGVVFNQLWTNETSILTTFPLSNIDHIEILYGPASATYGANAAMGVINVITTKDNATEGAHLRSQVSVGTPTAVKFRNMNKVADAQFLFKAGSLRLSATTHFESGVLDPSIGDKFEYTKNQYYRDESLWSSAAYRPGLAEGFWSPIDKIGVDLRMFLGQHPSCTSASLANHSGTALGRCTEVALQYFRLSTGNGTVYAADRFQTTTPWTNAEQSAYLRHTQDLTSFITSQTLVRYRDSSVVQPSFTLERATDGTVTGTYWSSSNHSFTVSQDFNITAGRRLLFDDDALGVSVGFRYERLDLDRRYLLSELDLSSTNPSGFAYPGGMPNGFPVPPDGSPHVDNRSHFDSAGAYALARYEFLGAHILHVGFRLDYNEAWRAEPVFRAGYVGRLSRELTAKLMYGQAYLSPSFRELYGVADASNGVTSSSSSLRPERSHNLEASVEYTQAVIGARLGAYYVVYSDAMVTGDNGPTNVDKRQVLGLDLGVNLMLPVPFMQQLKIWAYYSPILLAKQSVPPGTPTSATDPTPMKDGSVADVGDLAKHKILLGATGEFTKHLLLTVQGRIIGPRDTVSTNPVGTLPAYVVIDANLLLRDVITQGLSVGLRATNLLNTTYYQPGIRTASSGDTPGQWDGSTWVGSQGSYNSKLPQPGREVYLTLRLDI